MTRTPDGNNLPENKTRMLTVDWELYAHALEDSDLTDDEKREFIDALWYIVCQFVDLGFGIESTQQAMAARDAARLESSVPDTRLDSILRKPFEAANDPALVKEIKKKGI